MRHWKIFGICSHSWNSNYSRTLITLEFFDFTKTGDVYPFLDLLPVGKRILNGFHGLMRQKNYELNGRE
jgi:hypothetical protein